MSVSRFKDVKVYDPTTYEVFPVGTLNQILAINAATVGIENSARRSPSTGVQDVVRSFGQRLRSDALTRIRDGSFEALRMYVPSLVPGSIIESSLIGEVDLQGQSERTVPVNGTGLYLRVIDSQQGRHRIVTAHARGQEQ